MNNWPISIPNFNLSFIMLYAITNFTTLWICDTPSVHMYLEHKVMAKVFRHICQDKIKFVLTLTKND